MVIDRFYPHVGGTETQALNLSKKLQDKGIDVFVLTRRTLKKMAPIEKIDGVRVNRVLPAGTGKFSLLLSSVSFAFFLFRQRKNYDILHSHSFGWVGPVSALMGKLLRKKTIVKVATAGDVTGHVIGKKPLPGFLNKVRLALLKLADRVVCISHEIEYELKKVGFNVAKLEYLPNGVDTNRFRPGSGGRPFLLADKINMVFSGRLVYRKGLDILLQALEKSCRNRWDVCLHILGSANLQAGDEYDHVLKEFVKEYKLDKNVFFYGDVDNVEDYLKEADIFAFPSRHEGLPNALLEAMACELPVIATSIGGVVDVVKNHENGLLVAPDNVNDFLNALEMLISSPIERERLGRNARKTIENNYSMNTISTKYTELYNDLLKLH